jgi:O-antigen/teichoic acid export membrane protein
MPVEAVSSAVALKRKGHLDFFRQGGWMMTASTLAGLLMFLLHKSAKQMPKEEYGLFTTLLAAIGQMAIPVAGLQGVFAQQAAASVSAMQEKELAGMMRGVLRGTFLLWLIMASIIFVFRRTIVHSFAIPNEAALWIALLVVLMSLWRPVVQGVLLGRQNFLWSGATSLVEGAIRFGAVVLIVSLLGGYAAGATTGVLAGSLISFLITAWFTRDCLFREAIHVDWVAWLRRVVPLTLGLGVCSFMLSADMIFVRRFFPKDMTGYYAAAGMIGRALVYFTVPLTLVMFPKIARSKALREETSALKLTFGLTALAGAGAALMCTLFPKLPLRIVYDASFFPISAPLVPLFAWCMLPLTLSTVLINNLMAKSCFSSVPWLVAVAVAYGIALFFWHQTFVAVIRMVGCFGLVLLAVCAWFSFHQKAGISPGDPELVP